MKNSSHYTHQARSTVWLWNVDSNQKEETILEAFEGWFYRKVLSVSWKGIRSNEQVLEDIWENTSIENICENVLF